MKIDDKVITDFDSNNFDIVRTVLAVYKQRVGQSGVMIVVDHPKDPGFKDLVLDSDWFKKVEVTK